MQAIHVSRQHLGPFNELSTILRQGIWIQTSFFYQLGVVPQQPTMIIKGNGHRLAINRNGAHQGSIEVVLGQRAIVVDDAVQRHHQTFGGHLSHFGSVENDHIGRCAGSRRCWIFLEEDIPGNTFRAEANIGVFIGKIFQHDGKNSAICTG